MPVDRLEAFLRPDAETWGEEATFWRRSDVARWGGVLGAKESLARGAKKLIQAMKGDYNSLHPDELAALLTPETWAELEDLPFFADRAESIQAVRWWLSRIQAKDRSKYDYPARVHEMHGGRVLREKPKIVIGTGHSLKGSEGDIIFVFPEVSEAGWTSWVTDRDGRDGIIRLFYVMLTRAKEGVYLCQPCQTHHMKLSA